jgi:hypothetical protein
VTRAGGVVANPSAGHPGRVEWDRGLDEVRSPSGWPTQTILLMVGRVKAAESWRLEIETTLDPELRPFIRSRHGQDAARRRDGDRAPSPKLPWLPATG